MILGRVKTELVDRYKPNLGSYIIVQLKNGKGKTNPAYSQVWGYVYKECNNRWFATVSNDGLSGPFNAKQKAIRVCVLSRTSRLHFPMFRFNADVLIEMPEA